MIQRLLRPLVVLLLMACNAQPLYDMEYTVALTINTQLHAASLITRLEGNVGTFLFINIERPNTYHVLHIEANSGQKETLTLTTDRENNSIFGNGIANGLIVGCIFSTDPQSANPYAYVAYGRQCPDCKAKQATKDFSLQWADVKTSVKCNNCGRVYNLQVVGQGLKTYRARFDTNGMQQKFFSVSNK